MYEISAEAKDVKDVNDKSLKNTTVTIANGERPPFFSKNLKHHGVVSRIVKEAFAQEGIKVKYVFRLWKRGLEEAAKGKWHGTVGWMKNEYRKKYFYFTKAIVKYNFLFFQRKDNPIKWEKLADLKDATIGVVEGYYYGNEFAQAEDNGIISVLRGFNDRIAFRNLLDKRIDLFICEYNVGGYITNAQLTSAEAAQIEPQDKFVYSENAFLLLTKDKKESEHLVKIFNLGLQTLEQKGKIEKYWQELRRDYY